MKIKTIRIENFRSFQDETIEFGNYNCIVGPNGAGKSTVLNALNIFFRESKSSPVDLLELSKEDFHCSDTSKPIRITVTFTGLSDAAKESLKDYFRHDQLVVMAVAQWSDESQTATVVQKGLRLAMKEFAPFFEALGDGRLVAELKGIYVELRGRFQDLPAPGSKGAMTDALREYETAHADKCVLIESDDEFYGVSKGAHKLGPFIQWVFIPAVKEATDEQIESKDTALGRLIERTVRAKVNFSDKIKELRKQVTEGYDAVLKENQSVLDGLSASLKSRLTKWAHPGADVAVKWDKDPEKSIRVEEPFAKIVAGECGFSGELGRFGHGFRRSFLLALLEELASSEADDAPRLLLGIEEPELFQHPPQAQYLAEILNRLSEGNAQLFSCTHSPYFVVGKGFEDIRLIRKPVGSPKAAVTSAKFQDLVDLFTNKLGEPNYKRPEGVRAKINQTLQWSLKEIFFAPTLILVEGLEDLAYLQSGLYLLGLWEKWRASGANIVSANGKSMLVQPLAIVHLMKIPSFVIFDSDGDEGNADKKAKHQKDNERLLRLLDQPGHSPFPATISWNKNFVVWPKNLGAAIEADYTSADWLKWKGETEIELGQPGGLDKNSLLISGILSRAWGAGKPSATLTKLCETILDFAEKAVV